MEALADTVRAETNSLVMMEEAVARGHQVFHYHPDSVSLDNEGVFAQVAPVTVDLSKEDYFTLGAYTRVDLFGFDLIFFRQDPPFDMGYVTNTHILDMLKKHGVRVINNPFWIRNMPDKISIFDYPDYLPPTLVTRDKEQIKKFFAAHKDVVIKPLYGFHGHGVVRSSDIKDAFAALDEYAEPIMLQPFLKKIIDGNKRIVLFDGEIAGAIKNVPANETEFRVLRTSTDVAYEPSKRELELCRNLGPILKERGLTFVGVDLIGDYLTEINVGSVGTLRRLNNVYGGKSEARLWDVIEKKR